MPTPCLCCGLNLNVWFRSSLLPVEHKHKPSIWAVLHKILQFSSQISYSYVKRITRAALVAFASVIQQQFALLPAKQNFCLQVQSFVCGLINTKFLYNIFLPLGEMILLFKVSFAINLVPKPLSAKNKFSVQTLA